MNCLRAGILALVACALSASAFAAPLSRYQHIFVIIAENKRFDQIIGNPAAPELNRLAKEYGLATHYYGAVHPSEGNYVALLGGSAFGIHDDDAWFCEQFKISTDCPHSLLPGYEPHSIKAPSLMDQLQAAGLTWKGYFEDLPAPGSLEIYSAAGPKAPAELYAAKHNAFINFERVRKDPELARKIVPLSELPRDLAAGTVPNYAQLILNQCNDMHGLGGGGTPEPPADCVVHRGASSDALAPLIRRGDAAIGRLVSQIMAAPVWGKPENVAIVITWDEDNWNTSGPLGCCGYEPGSAANAGGGHVATIVVTNHGGRHIVDGEPYNHYSLLRTTEEAFGIAEHIGLAGHQGVKTMTPLFQQAGGQ